MIKIKTINNKIELKKLFDFLSKIFYENALEHNEHYFNMSERFTEMLEQLKKDKELLLYIEENGNIVAGLTSKSMDKEKQKITFGVMAVSKEHRKKGYAKALIQEMEKRCKNKNIIHIDFGARYRACNLYKKLGYKYSMMVQVFDFATIEDIKRANTLNLKTGFQWQGDSYGFVFFEIPDINEEYIKHFENTVPTAHAQYIFKKDL